MADAICDLSNLSQWKYIQSQYSWLILVLIVIYILIKQKTSQKTIPIPSSTQKQDTSTKQDPEYFFHLTDVHVNSLLPNLPEQLDSALKVISKYDPEMLIITGDLVDNWGTNTIHKYAKQYAPDHKIYKNITEPYGKKIKYFIDQPGNHDLFAAKSFDSQENNILKYSYYYSTHKDITFEEFQLSSKVIGNTTYIFVNPFNYPSPRALFDFFAHPTTELLDRLTKTIKSVQTKHKVIITHIPADLWDKSCKSSSGKSYMDIIKESDADLVISGHSHPVSAAPTHRNGVLEIFGSDLREHRGIGLVTQDNGVFVYHSMSLSNTSRMFVINPQPSDQLSQKSVFNEKFSKVRVLLFGDKSDIFVNHSKMSFIKEIKPNVYLYEKEVELQNGYNNLEISSNDEKKTVNVYVGEKTESVKEVLYNYYNKFCSFSTLFYILFPICLFILFPVPFEHYFQCTKDLMMRENIWIYSPQISFFNIIEETFLGFVSVRWRILRLPLLMRSILFFACLSPFFIPFVFIKIEDLTGIVINYGMIVRGNYLHDIWGTIFSAVYEMAVICPAIMLSSSIATSESFYFAFFIDFTFWLISFCVCLKFCNTYVTETAGTIRANTSPLFIFMPLILLGCIVFCKFYANPSKQSERLMFFQDLSNSNQIEL
ncbi:Ser/Thr protein phosphatase, putative [Trichomonas vaginalis G3]|uniref:Ser/Thr protein phosphatase, putative n=1 Tax=Trichomonas vaginalis (strain ATCC PRA-98 / G3) TaxID=412133 RepID=A2EWW9_TRIV3|nr:TMEM62, metallophosphatase domain-containing protein [Trichomonas vaginalis G3]EAY02884.1 Ser/Thr protein phosphatase, putative [Trichomonas vaginalis G3]KAI5497404.1 TMEM62, metallophosphatase domain-containing protein [Trichomonas vaginalis G3]|eukprot:XP_001315107.1 Ser/Thr protein phosphatase [Trichomonas vaginalis G3]